MLYHPRDLSQQSCSTRHRARAEQSNVTSSADDRLLAYVTYESTNSVKGRHVIARSIGSLPFFSWQFLCFRMLIEAQHLHLHLHLLNDADNNF